MKIFNKNLSKIPLGVAVINSRGTVLETNNVSLDYSHLVGEELVGKNIFDFVELTEEKKKIKKQVFLQGQNFLHPHLEVGLKKSKERKFLSVTIAPVKSPKGKVNMAVILFQDVTETKRIQDTMQQINDLKIMGEIAATTAHEIRNPLTVIKSLAQLGLLVMDEQRKNHYFQTMIEEVDYLNELLTELILLCPTTTEEKIPLNLEELFLNLLKLLQGQILLKQAKVNLVFPKNLPKVMGHSKPLKQAFLNLISNSLQSMHDHGQIEIRGEFLPKKRRIRLIISDTGEGTSQTNVEKMPSALLNRKKNRAGLGLPVTYKIIQDDHQGSITMQSQEGLGNKFLVELPSVDTNPQ